MVRTAVKTLTLNVYGIPLPAVQQFVASPPAATYFIELATYVAEQCQVRGGGGWVGGWGCRGLPGGWHLKTCLFSAPVRCCMLHSTLVGSLPLVSLGSLLSLSPCCPSCPLGAGLAAVCWRPFFIQLELATPRVSRCRFSPSLQVLDRLLSSWDVTSPQAPGSVEGCLAEVEDLLSYCNDVLMTGGWVHRVHQGWVLDQVGRGAWQKWRTCFRAATMC